MISVTTDTLPARERAEFWADLVSRHVTPVRIEPAGTHPLRGESRCESSARLRSVRQWLPAAAALFVRHSVDLLTQLVDESCSRGLTPTKATRSATFAIACQVIAIKFGEPDLTPADIARDIGVSSRYACQDLRRAQRDGHATRVR